ncbi:DUF4440 domain-containing protein [Brevibacillus fortis]|uniref:nuclear transport factor 2 family protein n=1 Tax=Brevibacillus fortis TaxID=2126352 RepID=UPI0038FD0896
MDKDLKQHIRGLEEQLLRPEVRSSPEELNKLLANDFREFGSMGHIFLKSDCIAAVGASGVFKMTLHNFDMHTLADDAVLATYQIIDETRNRHTLRSSIWKLRNGRWQLFFHQGTIIHLQP